MKWQPLQCSCLKNPMDGGAWWATGVAPMGVGAHGVAKSQTQLSSFTYAVPEGKVVRAFITSHQYIFYSLITVFNKILYSPLWKCRQHFLWSELYKTERFFGVCMCVWLDKEFATFWVTEHLRMLGFFFFCFLQHSMFPSICITDILIKLTVYDV